LKALEEIFKSKSYKQGQWAQPLFKEGQTMEPKEPVGRSSIHKSVIEKLTKIAATDAEVLIMGPSGVGKELYANFVHNRSRRKRFKFVPVNCGSLSKDLLENVLFGHVGGAFTGAKAQSEGLVSEAEGGTLFLDEVDSLSTPCQIKLLRFLQDKQYRRLGENHLRQANVRIMAATNADLETAVKEERFRKDLFFRLRVVPVDIPALHSRPEDILELLLTFTEKSAQKYNLPSVDFREDAIECMMNYEWPGNIRELVNCVEYLTCLHLQRPVVPDDLPLLNKMHPINSDPQSNDPETKNTNLNVVCYEGDMFQTAKSRLITNFEKQYIKSALQHTNGNISAAARLSGKNRRVLFELIRKHEINPDEFRIAKP
jgi:two-component system response regulator GlrR